MSSRYSQDASKPAQRDFLLQIQQSLPPTTRYITLLITNYHIVNYKLCAFWCAKDSSAGFKQRHILIYTVVVYLNDIIYCRYLHLMLILDAMPAPCLQKITLCHWVSLTENLLSFHQKIDKSNNPIYNVFHVCQQYAGYSSKLWQHWYHWRRSMYYYL